MKNIFFGILFLILGIGAAIACVFLFAVTPLRFDHPLLRIFGVGKPQIVGFLPYWLVDKADKNYAPYITTLTYFGLAVDVDGKPIFLINKNEEEPGWTTLKGDTFAAKREEAKRQKIKTSLLVHAADEDTIARLIDEPQAKAHALIGEVAPIMKSRGFTDLNLDIESFLPASESARASYTAFVKSVRDDMDAQNLGTLTVEIAPVALFKQYLIDPAQIGKLADYIVLMAYDYHYLGSFTAGAVAPIGGAGETIEFDVEKAIAAAVGVIPKEKILLGIPLYGYEWETLRPDKEAAVIPGGASTASTRRIAEFMQTCATCSAVIDPVSRQPYLIYPENSYFSQTYFENEASMQEKIALAQKYGLGGVALWALGYEDETILRPLTEYKKSWTFTGGN